MFVPARMWLLLFAGCLVAAVLDAFQMYLQAKLSGEAERQWERVTFQGAEWLLLAALTPITWYLGRRFPLRRPHVARALAVHFAGSLVLCVGWAAAGTLLRRALWRDASAPWLPDLASWTLTSVPWSVFMYFAILGCVHAFSYYIEARDREQQAAQLSGQLAEARLSALRMQLHPHFLFNSLNAITVLVRDQRTALAGRMLELLSDVLRQVLRTDRPHEVAVSEEIQLVQQYLAIEQVRFSDRLAVRFDINDALRNAAVPRFILQPLVENALRHGVSQRSDTVTVEIGVRRSGDRLQLWVRDDGPGIDLSAPSRGVGLENTRQRLQTLYGSAASLVLERAEGGGTLARVELPYRIVPADVNE
jgi:two-component system, LytTR family, sensor kinase